ncbi:NYN domain-containing protein [Phytoactinopolyspora halotolerans]|uniref:NYN domain-containing protein n=1 Tax=Phytoactinopolyspora halotolerans TaxID=1981512 RepID=A0A6L9S6R8_9ACTN|nr:NYN domain-containing protein [Phytoactinopolyspora halotolerans]NEE00673.1 NYN domain-containing protein [Phytoactinopolyspora halotolerans]
MLPPAGPPGTAGFSLSTPVLAYVVIDYQNIHLTAHDLFMSRRTPLKGSQIHPAAFAERILAVRPHQGPGSARVPAVILHEVLVFRGQPRSDRELRMYSVVEAQRAEWSQDDRVKLFFRPLKYPRRWPDEPAREKGIDVELALMVLTTAEDTRSSVVILATHDTDLEPALKVAFQRKGQGVQLETAGWLGGRRLAGDLNLRHTRLDAADFKLAVDPKDYSARARKAGQKRRVMPLGVTPSS